MFPVVDKILSYNLKGGVDGKWNDRFGLSIRECWLRFQEDRGFDVLSLGSLCDTVSSNVPPPYSHGFAFGAWPIS